MQVTLTRMNDAVHLRAENEDGNTVEIDGAQAVGGEQAGFRPMQLVLAAIASCSTMDLVPILEKQRQDLQQLQIRVNGERAEGTPAPFTSIHLHFTLTGNIDPQKAERAVQLAVEKYCSVAEMLKRSAEISHSFDIVEPA